jgi:cobalt-zinc-cadmium efflux system outer membrane protein
VSSRFLDVMHLERTSGLVRGVFMHRGVLLAAACVGVATHAAAQTVLTLEETISRAREQSGAVAVARARIAEAEAGVTGASARFRDNPLFEGTAGPRRSDANRYTDLDIGISQSFETGGQRRARVAAARAGVDRQRAEADEASRRAVFDAATAFVEGVSAGERLRIAEESDEVAREFLNAMERRYAAGDIAAIELNVARIDAARSAAVLRAARADLTTAVGALRALLRLPGADPIELRGSLDRPAPLPLASLRAAIDERPDFTALRAESREADAQVELGRALRRPDLGIRVGYEREESDTIVLGGLTVTVPLFQSGQGVLAAGAAHASRTRLELETARQAAVTSLETAYAVYQQQAALADAFARDAGPTVADTDTLARRSYEAGELDLMDLLLIRREALVTRTAVVDRRLAAARSRLMVDFIAGVLR